MAKHLRSRSEVKARRQAVDRAKQGQTDRASVAALAPLAFLSSHRILTWIVVDGSDDDELGFSGLCFARPVSIHLMSSTHSPTLSPLLWPKRALSLIHPSSTLTWQHHSGRPTSLRSPPQLLSLPETPAPGRATITTPHETLFSHSCRPTLSVFSMFVTHPKELFPRRTANRRTHVSSLLIAHVLCP